MSDMWAAGQQQTKAKFYILSKHSTVMQKGQALEPVSQRAHLLDPNQILELFMDRDSNGSPVRHHCCRG
jgi:hypothetical protein